MTTSRGVTMATTMQRASTTAGAMATAACWTKMTTTIWLTWQQQPTQMIENQAVIKECKDHNAG